MEYVTLASGETIRLPDIFLGRVTILKPGREAVAIAGMKYTVAVIENGAYIGWSVTHYTERS